MIIIAGDSWGEGYCQTDADGSCSPGFQDYWNKKHGTNTAVNISHGGNSNHQSISELEVYLAANKGKKCRAIVWLSCVLRDYPTGHPVDEIDQWVNRHYENIFDRVITLAHNRNCKIELLGGLGDIPRSFPENLSSRVVIKCHSTIKLIDPSYSFEMPYGHITEIDKIPNPEQRYKLLEYIEPKHNYILTPNGSCPDAGHFGAQQYQQIYEFLK